MHILVTGATGFIGRHLIPPLLVGGHSVRATTRSPAGRSVHNGGDVEWVVADNIEDQPDWGSTLDGIEVVIHAAGLARAPFGVNKEPEALLERVNTVASANLAASAVRAGVRRLVFLSSIKVHGETTPESPFRHTDTPNPRDAYARSKLAAEQYIQAATWGSGTEVVILRPPLVYGPGVEANFLQLIRWAAKGWPLPLASIRNRRSLVYVDNLVDALVCCVEHPSAPGHTFLVSDGEDLSTPGLIRALAQAMSKRARLYPFPPTMLRTLATLLGRGDQAGRLLDSLRVDSTHITQVLGWRPRHTVEEGLSNTARAYLARG